MSRFLSSFWAQKPQPEDGADGGGAMGGSTADGATGAASWITMKDPSAGDRGEPVMAVNQATVKGVLEPLGDKEAVNLVAIFGAARGGKSFLMNQLAGQDDIFKISNDKVSRRRNKWSNPLNHYHFAYCCCLLWVCTQNTSLSSGGRGGQSRGSTTVPTVHRAWQHRAGTSTNECHPSFR